MNERAILSTAAALALAAVATASIERLTLRQMVARADGAVYGEIVGRSVVAVPVFDGAEELYFTTLHVRGEDLLAGGETSVAVSYPGGFVDGERGVFNSEAPSADDVRIGRRVVVFYGWSDNMGGDFAGNALYASHGGLFRTFESLAGKVVVQGRGDGYAVSANQTLDDLRERSRQHREELRKR